MGSRGRQVRVGVREEEERLVPAPQQVWTGKPGRAPPMGPLDVSTDML